MKNILLACGAGASSGFIAQKMRKAAQKQGLEVSIRAVSDTEVMENIDGVGVLLIGPHLKHKFAEIEEEVGGMGVKAAIIDRKSYATVSYTHLHSNAGICKPQEYIEPAEAVLHYRHHISGNDLCHHIREF